MKCDLETFDLKSLEMKFDVILVNPPLEEYQRRASGVTFSQRPWRWEEVTLMNIQTLQLQQSEHDNVYNFHASEPLNNKLFYKRVSRASHSVRVGLL